VTNYHSAKFSEFSFSRFDFIVRTNTHGKSHTDAAKRFTAATLVGV